MVDPKRQQHQSEAEQDSSEGGTPAARPRSALTLVDNEFDHATGPRAERAGHSRTVALVHELLEQLGEDPNRQGLVRTPKRVADAYAFLTTGYHSDVQAILNNALFDEQYNEMVIVKDIDFYSLCEHHLLPFYGRCHVAYIPQGRVVGLSKIPRIVEVFARRLQVQERMTNEIAKTLMDVLRPAGVAVVTEARHLCMMMRGIQKQNTVVTNSALLGIFHDDRACREEFMQLIGHRQMS